MNTLVDIIMLTEDRFLGVAWKDGNVHNMWLTTDGRTAQSITEHSLTQKPARNDVFLNIERLVKNL